MEQIIECRYCSVGNDTTYIEPNSGLCMSCLMREQYSGHIGD